jgi:hypothetical protein
MSNKPNPESVAKVLAAGIVPGCKVRDYWGIEDVVSPVHQWECSGSHPDTVFCPRPKENQEIGARYLHLMAPDGKSILAIILEPAPFLPDTFNASAHSHLITERGENDYLHGRGAYEQHVADQTIATLRGAFRHDQRSAEAVDTLKRIREAINELMGADPTDNH